MREKALQAFSRIGLGAGTVVSGVRCQVSGRINRNAKLEP
jgi:hypothetical protein